MTRVCITVDVEHDCPPHLTSYRGVEEGMPALLALFAQERVQATLFTTGDVARRYPALVRRMVDEGHELGSHGDTHKRFSRMDRDEARGELHRSAETLRAYGPVTSFRAPNLDFPRQFVPLLRDEGYELDSSLGRHKMGSYFVKPHREAGVRRVPASISPSPLRTPGPVRDALCGLLEDPVVLFFHPWEFCDMTRTSIPWDCRVRTGEPALHHLREAIRYFRRRGAQFQRLRDLPPEIAAA